LNAPFGEAPGALLGVALMTDSDNTRSNTHAYYGPISVRTFAVALPAQALRLP
jgi:hypothetical protein